MPVPGKIAVVILNWNGKELFKKFLPSVVENSKKENVEIIVADNGSTDGSISFLQNNFPETKIIDLKENHGFTGGYNQALKNLDADYFVLLNSDIEVTPNWIEPCIARLESDENVAAVQPKILSYNGKNNFEYAGAGGGFIDWLGYPFCRGRILNVNEADTGQYDSPSPIFWATGACMFIRSSCFREAGGFDEDFWAHMEEIDLCWRLKNRGYSIWYQPESTVYHLGGGSLPYDNPKKIFLNFRNNLWMLLKNLPSKKILFVFMIRIILDIVAAFKLLTELKLKASLSVFRAYWHFCRTIARFLKKRKQLPTQASIINHPEIYRGSIIRDFYLKGKTRFSQIDFN